MSRRDRRKFTATLKAQVVIEALKERKTMSELAQQFDLHPNQITTWKKEFLQGAAGCSSKVPVLSTRRSKRSTMPCTRRSGGCRWRTPF